MGPSPFRFAPALIALQLGGCAYYNGMWSAERLARDARRQESRRLDAVAKLSWARAAVRAESVLARHPNSRWADDALVLQGEGLARSGACQSAARPLERALSTVVDTRLRERAALAAAECVFRYGREGSGDVERLLAPVLVSRDGPRRSRAAYLAGRAALERGDATTAAALFERADLPQARTDRIRALLAAGRPGDALADVEPAARTNRDEADWTAVLDAFARTAGATAASDALDRVLVRGRVPLGARARLLIADGDRLRAARLFDRAVARYTAASVLVPDSLEAGRARVRTVLADAARAERLSDLDAVGERLQQVMIGLGGAVLGEARATQAQLVLIRNAEDTSEVAGFRAAELARDSLGAPALATSLLLQFATRHPTSLFAPKALIAAAYLRPDAIDSVEQILRVAYAESPYTRAFHGAPSPAYQALEDSLAIAFGVTQPRTTRAAGTALHVGAPRPGPRGPDLESLADLVAARSEPAAGPRERRPPRAPPPRPGVKPPTRPEDRP